MRNFYRERPSSLFVTLNQQLINYGLPLHLLYHDSLSARLNFLTLVTSLSMETFRAGEVLLRTASTFTTLRYASRTKTQIVRSPIDSSRVCWVCRQLSTQAAKCQQAAARAAPFESTSNATSETHIADVDQKDKNLLNEALDLKHTFGVAAKPTRLTPSPSAQRTLRSTTSSTQSNRPRPLPGNSLTDVLKRFSDSVDTPIRKPSSFFPSSGETSKMLFPEPDTPAGSVRTTSKPKPKPPPSKDIGELRLNSRTGLTLDVDPRNASDLGVKLRRLNATVGRNKVPQDFRKQRFHERPGLKRKRLKSVRWRRRFAAGFQKAVSRVQELRRKGW